MTGDKVWALHDFEAENPDEVSFKAGEYIVVVEKDDAYGDGWWQGTNLRGETGLFPFTYTTTDQSKVAAAQNGSGSADPGTTPQQASSKAGVMQSTMVDIDNALTELQGERRRGRKSTDGPARSRASSLSERTADLTADDASEIYGNSEDYASRSAAARAALAVNAQRDLQTEQEQERQEEQRRRAEALKEFEEEEARQRDLLLQKERERQAQAAAGTLDLTRDDKPRVAPIAGVAMSDESDSEGSVGDLDDFGDNTTHSPLFGNLASASDKKAQAGRTNGSSLKNVVEPDSDAIEAPPTAQSASSAVAAAAADAAEPEIVPPSAAMQAASSATSQAPISPTEHGAPVAALAAGVGAVALGATTGTAVITSRSVSPVPLSHRKADASTESRPNDQRSIDESSRGRASIADESVTGGTGTIGTAATSLAGFGGVPETPKSGISTTFPPSMMSSSQIASGAAVPNSDPTEWSVEQVVDWGRSKGWDENSVVSKFAEHEITGDVLLEMDVNILKEIDIVAFGKRFQVANAIKELRKLVPGAEPLVPPTPGGRSQSSGPISPGPDGAAAFVPAEGLMPPQSPHGHVYGPPIVGGRRSSADVHSVGQRGAADTSYDSGQPGGSRSRPGSSIGEAVNSNGQAYAGAGGVAAWQAQQANQQSRVHSREPSDGYGRDIDRNDDDESLAALKERKAGPRNRRSTRSNEDTLGALPASPRKRESAGSGSHNSRGATADRTPRFFGIGQRNRKPPPRVMSVAVDDDRIGKGTLSRLGFARSSRAILPQDGPHGDLKNNISLPTTSPSYDSNGDTARRNRLSTQSGASGNTAEPKYGRATSIGSAGAGAKGNDWNAAAAGLTPGSNGAAGSEGPVMNRIRPVDLEGWMRKKGERYNSWKPRYLALKGSDLVILRDPQAEKIKGHVSMKGYKVIADENTNPGKYGFKILHETEKPHYFSSEDPILVREWMKGLMKATIGRDHSFPVISSYNNATMSLKEAQRMNPPPRPPSPTSRARTQRAKARQNTDQLTARDAAILMNLSPGPPTATGGNGLTTPVSLSPKDASFDLSAPILRARQARRPSANTASNAHYRLSSSLLPDTAPSFTASQGGNRPPVPRRSDSRRIPSSQHPASAQHAAHGTPVSIQQRNRDASAPAEAKRVESPCVSFSPGRGGAGPQAQKSTKASPLQGILRSAATRTSISAARSSTMSPLPSSSNQGPGLSTAEFGGLSSQSLLRGAPDRHTADGKRRGEGLHATTANVAPKDLFRSVSPQIVMGGFFAPLTASQLSHSMPTRRDSSVEGTTDRLPSANDVPVPIARRGAGSGGNAARRSRTLSSDLIASTGHNVLLPLHSAAHSHSQLDLLGTNSNSRVNAGSHSYNGGTSIIHADGLGTPTLPERPRAAKCSDGPIAHAPWSSSTLYSSSSPASVGFGAEHAQQTTVVQPHTTQAPVLPPLGHFASPSPSTGREGTDTASESAFASIGRIAAWYGVENGHGAQEGMPASRSTVPLSLSHGYLSTSPSSMPPGSPSSPSRTPSPSARTKKVETTPTYPPTAFRTHPGVLAKESRPSFPSALAPRHPFARWDAPASSASNSHSDSSSSARGSTSSLPLELREALPRPSTSLPNRPPHPLVATRVDAMPNTANTIATTSAMATGPLPRTSTSSAATNPLQLHHSDDRTDTQQPAVATPLTTNQIQALEKQKSRKLAESFAWS